LRPSYSSPPLRAAEGEGEGFVSLPHAGSTYEPGSIHSQAPFQWRERESSNIQSTRVSSRYSVSVSNIQPRRSLLEATPAILENSSLRSSQKNSNPCHDYLCIVISVFLLFSFDFYYLYSSFIILNYMIFLHLPYPIM